MDYYDYLETYHWKKFRARIRKQRKVCEWCGARTRLEIHHRHYNSLWHEQDRDVNLLCRECHQDVTDGRLSVPPYTRMPGWSIVLVKAFKAIWRYIMKWVMNTQPSLYEYDFEVMNDALLFMRDNTPRSVKKADPEYWRWVDYLISRNLAIKEFLKNPTKPKPDLFLLESKDGREVKIERSR